MKSALTIAGSDPGGGAGIQADTKTLHALGVYATSAITAVTVQNTSEVRDVVALPGELVRAQCDAVFDDFQIAAVKTGMLGSAEVVTVVADVIRERKVQSLVVDPVIGSSDGFILLEDDALEVLRTSLLPLARVVTPNIPEAERLAGMKIKSAADMHAAAKQIAALGAQAVVITGGHAPFAPGLDILHHNQTTKEYPPESPLDHPDVHGTGCAFSAAIAAHLALGDSIEDAVGKAKRYVTAIMQHALAPGAGRPIGHHFHFLKPTEPPA